MVWHSVVVSFAVFGAASLLWHLVQVLVYHVDLKKPLTIVMVVQNAEKEIEGLVRMMLVKSALTLRPRKLYVIDLASNDETERILEYLVTENANLSYLRVEKEEDFLSALKKVGHQDGRLSCIYDLRVNSFLDDRSFQEMMRF